MTFTTVACFRFFLLFRGSSIRRESNDSRGFIGMHRDSSRYNLSDWQEVGTHFNISCSFIIISILHHHSYTFILHLHHQHRHVIFSLQVPFFYFSSVPCKHPVSHYDSVFATLSLISHNSLSEAHSELPQQFWVVIGLILSTQNVNMCLWKGVLKCGSLGCRNRREIGYTVLAQFLIYNLSYLIVL